MVCILCLTSLDFIGIIDFFLIFFLIVRHQEVLNHGNQLDNCHGVLNYEDKSLLTTQPPLLCGLLTLASPNFGACIKSKVIYCRTKPAFNSIGGDVRQHN